MSDIARLRWLCRRGMKELDEVMIAYLENQYSGARQQEQQAFKTLLTMSDLDIMALLSGKITVSAAMSATLIESLQQAVKKNDAPVSAKTVL